MAFGFVAVALEGVPAAAQQAAPSSTAAFPMSPANAPQTESSRAGFPAPEPQSSSPPPDAGTRTLPPASSQPGPPSTPGYGQFPRASGSYPSGSYGQGQYRPGTYGQGWYGAESFVGGPSQGRDNSTLGSGTQSDEDPRRYVSLTLSAIRLVLPVFEATLEARLVEHLGIAVFGGIGHAPPEIVGEKLFDASEPLSLHEVGGQILIYPLRDFDGFVLGAEPSYTRGTGTASVGNVTFSDASFTALAFGPLIGGKWVHRSGFTLFGNAGVQRVWLDVQGTAQGQSYTHSDAIWFPLVNLNVGWSF